MVVPACAVLSLTDWHPKKIKTNKYIMKIVIFRKQIEFAVTIGQPPAGLVKPGP